MPASRLTSNFARHFVSVVSIFRKVNITMEVEVFEVSELEDEQPWLCAEPCLLAVLRVLEELPCSLEQSPRGFATVVPGEGMEASNDLADASVGSSAQR